jgi:CDP-diacylglycerol--glycerol-3-phosphate 3-phosphatidyltransferase
MLANGLTMARVFLAPAVAYSLYRDGQGIGHLTLTLMLAAGATDILDGWAARRLGQTSPLGRILDPLADKLFIGCVCVSLVLLRGFPAWLVALQAARDLAIVAVGTFLLRSRRHVVPASLLGKVATWSMGLTLLAHVLRLGEPWAALSQWVTALLIVVSGAGYARKLMGGWGLPQPAPAEPSSSSRTEA